MSSRIYKISLFLFVIVSTSFCKVFVNGGLEVTKEKKKTIEKISGFPTNVTVLVIDEGFNLLSAGTTNNVGAAQIKLNKEIKSVITVRTVNGDYEVTTRPKTRQEELQEIMADNKTKHTQKA